MLRKNVSLGQFLSVVVLASVLAVTGSVLASSTISTNITTEGTLAVTGLSTLSGGATTTSITLLNGEVISNGTDGVIQMNGIASSTSITLLNGETITNATDGTIALSGAMTVSGVSSFTGLATLLGGATTTSLTLLNGEVISNATDGTISFGTSNLSMTGNMTVTGSMTMSGTASTSALKVGDEPAAPTINGMVFGYCTFDDVTSFTASTTAFVDCTTTPAGALTATDRVFVQATSSFDAPFVIQSASSTGVSTINFRVLNTGLDGAADETLGGTSINFWAVR